MNRQAEPGITFNNPRWPGDPCYADQPCDFEMLSPARRACLVRWIETAFVQATPGQRQRRCKRDSYNLKHFYERGTGFYITPGQFKGAMLLAGFEPIDRAAHNWVFKGLVVRRH